MRDEKMDSQEEFKEVFETYGKRVFRYIYIRVGNRRAVAEDLTQDVFERLWKNRGNYDPGKSSLQTWIFSIARNRLTDHYRKKREVPGDPEGEDVLDKRESARTGLIEDASEVYDAIDTLSEKDRDLITFRYIEEMDLDEIAEVMDMTYEAVKVASHRALKRLKEKLNEEHN